MLTEIEKGLLETIADMKDGQAEGAVNIRVDGKKVLRNSTDTIRIESKTDKDGIDIYVAAGSKNGSVHIPVVLTETGFKDKVYNDFFIGEGAEVDIVAGCGINNCGCDDSQHDGIHTFYVGKNAKVTYSEKHYGEGTGTGKRILNPQTIIYLEEGASMTLDLSQIGGVDDTKRYTKAKAGKDSELIVQERLLTDGNQNDGTEMDIYLEGRTPAPESSPAVWPRAIPPRSFIPESRGMPSASAMCPVTPSSWNIVRCAPFQRSPATMWTPPSSTKPPSARSQGSRSPSS